MNTEQERADFEAWWEREMAPRITGEATFLPKLCWEAYQAGRAALQSQDREDAERYRAWRAAAASENREFLNAAVEYGHKNFADPQSPTADELDAAIDHARRIEGDGE